MPAFFLPPNYARVRVMDHFEEILTTPFKNGFNAHCWQRELSGDFNGVVKKLKLEGGITPLDEDFLKNEIWSSECQLAVNFMLRDTRMLREQGLLPELNGIAGYERDQDAGLLRTDVYSFHADSATDEADTWLCTYLGAPSEGLNNEEALRRVDDPSVREILLKDYGGEDGEGFREYLSDHCYDLHYAPISGACPFNFGTGNLWRIAVDYPASSVPPCIHRAPESVPGSLPRLLLIA